MEPLRCQGTPSYEYPSGAWEGRYRKIEIFGQLEFWALAIASALERDTLLTACFLLWAFIQDYF